MQEQEETTGPEATHFAFGWAIKQMHNSNKVSRAGWNGPGQYLMLQITSFTREHG